MAFGELATTMPSKRQLDLVALTSLMTRTAGDPQVAIGVIDGPVAAGHPAFQKASIEFLAPYGAATEATGAAAEHGTFVAGLLCADRDSESEGICPGCRILVRPIFRHSQPGHQTSASSDELAQAIRDCVSAGARIVNLSAAMTRPLSVAAPPIDDAIRYAASKGVLVVVAAGNQGILVGTQVSHKPWVIPVVACNLSGRPTAASACGPVIGKAGLMAPGENVVGVGTRSAVQTLSGSSAAVPFVTGAIALMWSLAPQATAWQIRASLLGSFDGRRRTIFPPLLNACQAFQRLNKVAASEQPDLTKYRQHQNN